MPKCSVIGPEKSSTVFTWTEGELKFLLKLFADFKSQLLRDKLIQDTRKNSEKIKEIFDI